NCTRAPPCAQGSSRKPSRSCSSRWPCTAACRPPIPVSRLPATSCACISNRKRNPRMGLPENPASIHVAYVGLGANLGNAVVSLRPARPGLVCLGAVARRTAARLYRTAPLEADGPDYINTVARLHTTLAPLALLDALQAIENAHGRQRPYRNAPRTLDLDLL